MVLFELTSGIVSLAMFELTSGILSSERVERLNSQLMVYILRDQGLADHFEIKWGQAKKSCLRIEITL